MSDKRSNGIGWVFSGPYLIYTSIFFLVPLVASVFLAFTNWNLISPEYDWVGLKNFLKALKRPEVFAAFVNTFKFMALFIPVSLALSMLIAVIVHSLPRFRSIYLAGFFLPYLASGVISSLIAKGLLSYNSAFNVFLREKWGLDIDWLGSPFLALLVVVLMLAWKFSGYYALILTAGLESINKEVYEAAMIDGATSWQQFSKITLPLLYPAIYTVLILAVGVTFGIFTEVYQLTGGGPDNATTTWQLNIFIESFTNLRAGYASAIALIASAATFISIFIIRKILELWGKRHGWG
ncbi:carbohydrate ABC transporter permease [Lihuaxuella thermophila]|uniref:Multiple sugar transport system permease protein n=1 Tax=Lihuaxuella thermophila TaxID=1173111 RepID=A0A1H8CH94_9BACL|nr:sugar ABC transporter permease [Lihuaxuella thermophila]SEM94366.1 multiple sugar transport system permease protein [Lihuaxuella thermophila]